MVSEGKLFAVQEAGYWVDAGTPESYLKVALDLVNGVRAAEPAIADDATIAGDAQIIGSIIGPGAIIEPGAVVERSMLHPRVRIGEGARVVDSIVGSGACIGARARLTELTVVGESVEIGANSTHARSKIPG
jgi:mannose-1-phosphate guanylyltransferase